MVGLDWAVLGGNRRAFDERQEVALHALAADVGATAARAVAARADLVDLVEENDAVVLDELDRFDRNLVAVEELVALLRDELFVALADGHAPRPRALTKGFAQHVTDVDHADLTAGNIERRERRRGVGKLDFDLLIVEFVGAQALAKRFARRWLRARANEGIEHALLGILLGHRLDVAALSVAHETDPDLDEVAHDAIDVTPDIADLGEFRRLDLEERRACKPREAA